jgi:hypothetical protein
VVAGSAQTLAGQIAGTGQCASEGPVLWGRASADSMIPSAQSDESIEAGLSPNMRLRGVEGRVALDCEEGVLVFRQFALAPNREVRKALEVAFDATGHVRNLLFKTAEDSLADFAVVTINSGSGVVWSISTFGTSVMWFDIEGISASYREILLSPLQDEQ